MNTDDKGMNKDDKRIYADLLRERMTEGRELINHYRTLGFIFLAINATLATLLFKDRPFEAPLLLDGIGLAITIHFIWVTRIEKHVRAPLEADMAALNAKLGNPLGETRLVVLEYFTLAAYPLGWITLLSWIAIVIFHILH